MAKKILALVAVVLGFLVGIIAMEPDTSHIQRSVEIQATPAQVWPHVLDLHRFVKWSPWSGLDPNQKVTFEGPDTGVGASYSWAGNDKVGKGKMKVTRVVPNEAVRVELEFIEPFASKADVGYTLTPTGGGTKVMWWYDSPNTFMTKAMGLVMNMDKMLGGDFERGLASLKKIVEEEAKAAPAAPAPAQPAEPAPAAAGSSGGAAAPK